MFNSVLIANRGEIALRIARSCRELGLRTVAVYSTDDRDSQVVRFADTAVHIGPSRASQSYLNIPAIIEAARQSGAQAVHPGYGFLSEDPDFAEVCEANGLVFIGAPAEVLAHLGDKAVARRLMALQNLPLLAGEVEPVANADSAARAAASAGFPVIIKAVAGGGGRGMIIVRDPADIRRGYAEARAHAQAVFSDGRVYLERYLEGARHVEVQVIRDSHGNSATLGDRDCSVQRRHQKLIEEAPAPALPGDLRARMHAAAQQGADAVRYVGVGTFEFLVSGQDFYFMEVNCRIQVEHPVTEMVTGIDLVQEQIRIASGHEISFRGHGVRSRGVAIECRINAEDPVRDFIPTPGILDEVQFPGGPFVRVDTHAYPGCAISPAYDPLIAKIVVWAPDRPAALARMRRALDEVRVRGRGVSTTAAFLRDVMDNDCFVRAAHTTGFVEGLAQASTKATARAQPAPAPFTLTGKQQT